MKTDSLKRLIEYLVANDIPLVTFNQRTQRYGLNQMLSCEKKQLKEKYNIDIDRVGKGGFSK